MMNAAAVAAAWAASVSSVSCCWCRRRRTTTASSLSHLSSFFWASASASLKRRHPLLFVRQVRLLGNQSTLLGNQSTTTASTTTTAAATTLGDNGTPSCRRRRRLRCRRRASCGSPRHFYYYYDSSCSSSGGGRSFGTQLPSPKQQRNHPKLLPMLWTVDETTGILSRPGIVQQQYQVIVGFEIHVQLLVAGSSSINTTTSNNKLFSGGTVVVGPPNATAYQRPVRSPSSTSTTTATSSVTQPNTAFHPFDAAVPGYLPLLLQAKMNSSGGAGHWTVVHRAVAAAILCHSNIQRTSRFERKHYYYADLPHGYQITQQRWPIARGGYLPITASVAATTDDDASKDATRCQIVRMQLEMDTAKTTMATSLEDSWIDVDRAGTALLEIVTMPDIRSPLQAVTVVQNLHALLTHSGVTRGRMELGEFRVDVNVNLENRSTQERNGRVEIKNLNSFAQIRDSVVYEAIRQATEWWSEVDDENDDDPAATTTNHRYGPETRTWDAALQQTVLLRRKDTAQEYRFLPEPDLPPLKITDAFVDRVRASLPELPSQTIERLVNTYTISDYQASTLVREESFDAVQLFEDTCHFHIFPSASSTEGSVSPKLSTMAANLIVNELFALLQAQATTTSSHNGNEDAVWRPLEAWQLYEMVEMLHEETISLAVAKKLLGMVVVTQRSPPSQDPSPSSPRKIVKDMGWELVTDRDELLATCRQMLEAHPKQADEYVTCTMDSLSSEGNNAAKARRNQQRLTKLLMGKAVSALGGKAHPERLHEALRDVLEELVASKRPSSSKSK